MNSKTEIAVYEILKCLPHRYPFLLVDKVLDYQVGKSLRALKNVTVNEPYFVGHFPEKPIMPGVLILEALAQSGGVLLYLSEDEQQRAENPDSLYFFAGIDNARFKQIVKPGDQLILEITVTKRKRDVSKVNAVAMVDGKVVCSADLMCAYRRFSG